MNKAMRVEYRAAAGLRSSRFQLRSSGWACPDYAPGSLLEEITISRGKTLATINPRWTEDELRKEIERLRERISQISQSANASARAAVSYLNQMLRDRRAELASLRRRRVH